MWRAEQLAGRQSHYRGCLHGEARRTHTFVGLDLCAFDLLCVFPQKKRVASIALHWARSVDAKNGAATQNRHARCRVLHSPPLCDFFRATDAHRVYRGVTSPGTHPTMRWLVNASRTTTTTTALRTQSFSKMARVEGKTVGAQQQGATSAGGDGHSIAIEPQRPRVGGRRIEYLCCFCR